MRFSGRSRPLRIGEFFFYHGDDDDDDDDDNGDDDDDDGDDDDDHYQGIAYDGDRDFGRGGGPAFCNRRHK